MATNQEADRCSFQVGFLKNEKKHPVLQFLDVSSLELTDWV